MNRNRFPSPAGRVEILTVEAYQPRRRHPYHRVHLAVNGQDAGTAKASTLDVALPDAAAFSDPEIRRTAILSILDALGGVEA